MKRIRIHRQKSNDDVHKADFVLRSCRVLGEEGQYCGSGGGVVRGAVAPRLRRSSGQRTVVLVM
jgi:hypothetical protein